MTCKSIEGCLLGTAVADALGLPYEGLNPDRAARLLGRPENHKFFRGRGMVSDDTEHTVMSLMAFVQTSGEPVSYQKAFAQRLKIWLLCLPAGVGLATLKSVLKLVVGVPPSRSGVKSAGNGPAMRAAILGVVPGGLDCLEASTAVTHTDPRALQGALLIAHAAKISAAWESIEASQVIEHLKTLLPADADQFVIALNQVADSLKSGEKTTDFARRFFPKKGVSGYVLHTVPAALHAWLSHPDDYRSAVQEIILCGGDADTTAAIVGGIVGARVGPEGIPQAWQNGLAEPVLNPAFFTRLAKSAADRRPFGHMLVNPDRNIKFLAIVLAHGFRRILPPY